MVDFRDLSDEQQDERLEALARLALAEYGLSNASLRLHSRRENAVFEVIGRSSDMHASLRVCRPGWETDALRREISWLEALGRDDDLRVPVPIRTKADEAFCVVQTGDIPGPRACVLFHWVSGAFAEPEALTPSRMNSVGRFLARLHDHAEAFRLSPELATAPFDADALDASDQREHVSAYFTKEADLAAFDEAIAATVDLMRALGSDATVAGIVHGDFHQRNYVFDGERVGALDFETMWWGYYLYDLATTLSYLVPRFLRDTDPRPLRSALLAGYSQARGLADGHPRMLQVFSAYRAWIMADWSTSNPHMLEWDWVRRDLDATPAKIRELLAGD